MKKMLILALLCALLLQMGWTAMAEKDDYRLAWWTLGGGGTTSTNNEYAVSSTIGQYDAGKALDGSRYRVSGGYWSGVVQFSRARYEIYLPIVERFLISKK